MDVRQVLFGILDVKAETFFPPFCANNKFEALRMFGDLLTGQDSRLAQHPEDYRLYTMGEYDRTTGHITAYATGPVLVEEGLALVTPKSKEA